MYSYFSKVNFQKSEKLIKGGHFCRSSNQGADEKHDVWKQFQLSYFKKAATNFVECYKSKNYREHVSEFQDCKDIGCNMRLKVYFLHSHIDLLFENLSEGSEKHVECSHKGIARIERCYYGKGNSNLLHM